MNNILRWINTQIKKIFNSRKADTIAVCNALDIASGGSLSLIKQGIAQTFQGFLEAKFNNLVLDVLSNDIREDELIAFIHSQSESNKEFISNLILKNLHADNRITTFLLAKLWVQKMRNGALNYYESSLFSNINTLTVHDFEVFYDSFRNISFYQNRQNMFETTTSPENEHYITSLNKYKSIGIIADISAFDGGSIVEEAQLKINFLKTPFSDTFFEHLKEFFENN
ncbi:MAG: hypothetical protein PHV10_02410 [Sulfuricurvum sp.]|nr:hypothetical protein [Sulfuricurvum sp.]